MFEHAFAPGHRLITSPGCCPRPQLAREEAVFAVGAWLAEDMRRLLDAVDLQRAVVAGGDSLGEVASALGIVELTVTAAMRPSAPLCRAWSRNAHRDRLEIADKGGQSGSPSFFCRVRDGNQAP